MKNDEITESIDGEKLWYDLTKNLISIDLMKNPIPRYFELDLTNYCNLNCSFCCSRKEREKPKVSMSEANFTKHLGLAIQYHHRHGCGITFTGGGEPTLHPEFKSFFGRALTCLQRGAIGSLCMVCNGANIDNVRHFLINTQEPKSWVRISVNDQAVEKFLPTFQEFKGRIGASFIWQTEMEKAKCEYNAEILRPFAKFIRIRKAVDYDDPSSIITPETCIGRFYHHVIESDGTKAYCCQARGLNGKPPTICPRECRWAGLTLKKLEEMNLFS